MVIPVDWISLIKTSGKGGAKLAGEVCRVSNIA